MDGPSYKVYLNYTTRIYVRVVKDMTIWVLLRFELNASLQRTRRSDRAGPRACRVSEPIGVLNEARRFSWVVFC